MGFLFVGSVGIIPQWFSKRRSLANGIGTAGSGLGGLTYSLATNAMIDSIGVGWAFRTLGLLCCGVNSVCALLVKDRNKIIGAKQLAFDYTLFRRGEYWLLLGWGFFSMLGYVVLLFSLPNFAVSVGLSARQGSEIGALLNLGQGLGRPAVGIFSDSAGRINLAGLCTFVAGFLCLVMWIFAKSYGTIIFFAILVGTVSGTFWTSIGPVGAEVVGLKELPSALSIMWLFIVIPTTCMSMMLPIAKCADMLQVAEPIGLELRHGSGAIYLHAQIFTGLMYIAAAICTLFLRAWKIGEVENEERKIESEARETNKETSNGRHADCTQQGLSKRQSSNLMARTIKWRKV